VSSFQPRRGYGLLRCPLCSVELAAAAGALVCRNRHSFDLAREGYVTLLQSRRRGAAAGGDSAAQLRYRAAFLDAGHFDAIAATIAEHVLEANAKPPFGQWCVLDAGSGTGHHLAKLAVALPPPVIGLGLDIAKDAVRWAARHWVTLAFAVADLWAEWPVRDAARVLRPGGWLALVYPGPAHLIELRDRFGLIGQHEDKTRRYSEREALRRTAYNLSALQSRDYRRYGNSCRDPEDGPECPTYRRTNS